MLFTVRCQWLTPLFLHFRLTHASCGPSFQEFIQERKLIAKAIIFGSYIGTL
jgi:hypothetical protein